MEDKLPRRIAWFAPWTWKRRWWIVGVVSLGLVGYPLSYGPSLLLMSEGHIPYRTFCDAYSPIFWSASHNDRARNAVNWYGNLFQPKSRSVTIDDYDIFFLETHSLDALLP